MTVIPPLTPGLFPYPRRARKGMTFEQVFEDFTAEENAGAPVDNLAQLQGKPRASLQVLEVLSQPGNSQTALASMTAAYRGETGQVRRQYAMSLKTPAPNTAWHDADHANDKSPSERRSTDRRRKDRGDRRQD